MACNHVYDTADQFESPAKRFNLRGINKVEQTQATNSLHISPSVWTIQEDNLLKKLVQKLGQNWLKIAEHFSHKSIHTIRQRYRTKLSPLISKEHWSQSEDFMLETLVKLHGANLNAIAQSMIDRTVPAIRTRIRELGIENSPLEGCGFPGLNSKEEYIQELVGNLKYYERQVYQTQHQIMALKEELSR